MTPTETYIETRQYVQPSDTNTHGTLHGGSLMKWLDTVAAMSAMRHAGTLVSTVNIQDIDFDHPVQLGEIALITAYVFDTGNTSMNVCAQAHQENPYTGETTHITTSTFTFVALDEDNSPTPVGPVHAETEKDHHLIHTANELTK